MNTERIKEIQQETAYPESISVQQALLKVWNECEQEKAVKNNAVLPYVSKSVCPKCGNTGRCEPRTLSDPDGQECDCWQTCL